MSRLVMRRYVEILDKVRGPFGNTFDGAAKGPVGVMKIIWKVSNINPYVVLVLYCCFLCCYSKRGRGYRSIRLDKISTLGQRF